MAQEQGLTPPPSSPTLLDTLLQNLYDFGDTEETEQKKIRKKREHKKKDESSVASLVVERAPLPGSLLRSQKKNASSFFEELREELHCAPAVTSPDAPSGPEVPAAALSSSPTKKTRDRVEVVEFHSRHKKRKLKQAQDGSTKAKTSVLEKGVDVQEFNLEKPPKNSYVNYKVLQEQIKEKQAAKEKEKKMVQDTDIFKKKKRKGQEERKSKKKKSAPSILSSGRAGQVGKFKNGTLILSPSDIKKINSSRVAK
uniref:Uncharacterized protein n=1 Tax=Oryctolagus cuniculus TaxID=9986 RepID=G1TWJ9_RABIT